MVREHDEVGILASTPQYRSSVSGTSGRVQRFWLGLKSSRRWNPKSWPTESDSLSKSICFEAEVCLPLLIEFVKAGWIGVVECVQAIGLISTNDGFAIEPTA